MELCEMCLRVRAADGRRYCRECWEGSAMDAAWLDYMTTAEIDSSALNKQKG